MTLPILSYGHRILRQRCADVDSSFPDLDVLINNMWETLYGANGCGLAASQVNIPIRLFLVDSRQTYAHMTGPERATYFEGETGIQETFINARITDRSPETWVDEEGCLSIPRIAQPVARSWRITISYFDRNFHQHTKTFSGTTARMIQHEYDHTEGVLYLDYLKPVSRRLLQGKLAKISKGAIRAAYPMKYLK